MNKVLAFIMVLLPFVVAAQTTVNIGSVHGNNVYIVMKKNSNKPDYIRIPIETSDAKEASIHLKVSDASKFRGLIFEARMKYMEWVKVAEENDVGDFSKDLPVKFPWTDFFVRIGDWHYAQAKFKLMFVKKDGVCVARYSDGVHKFGNQYITAYLHYTFYGEEDFNEWLDVLSHDNIQSKLADATNYDLDKKENNVDYNKLFN